MAITITVIESLKQRIAEIPEYISVSIDGVPNANVYYTLDGSNPDPNSLSTILMEHAPGDPLHGTIFLPTSANFLSLNMLAVGPTPGDTATFYRRYGLDSRKHGSPTTKELFVGETAFIVTPSPNLTASGEVIASDGYTEGSITYVDIQALDTDDGYTDAFNAATSGQQVTIPAAVYDHVVGFTDGDNPDGYVTTTLTPEQEQELIKLSDRGDIFLAVPDPTSPTGSKLVSDDTLRNIDPRSTTVIDTDGRQIEVIPLETEPAGYTENVSAGTIDDNFADAADQDVAQFVSGGIFDPLAAYIEIDGRVDGYINGQPVKPGDRVIINKPFGDLRYIKSRQDLGDAVRKTETINQGGFVCSIPNYRTGEIFFYYADLHDQRWIVSEQKFTPPQYDIFAINNGVVAGQVFKWITNKRQVLPG